MREKNEWTIEREDLKNKEIVRHNYNQPPKTSENSCGRRASFRGEAEHNGISGI